MIGDLEPWANVGAAIALLTRPHGEVVMHDLRTGRIAAVWNAISGRKAGDESLIEEDTEFSAQSGVYGPYRKTGIRGETIKTVSALLPDADGNAIAMLCINIDVTQIEHASRYLAMLATADLPRPKPLFQVDWRERIQERVHAAATQCGKNVHGLSRQERTEVIAALNAEGLFETRNSVEHAARVLGVSRTTIYNHLRALAGEAAQ